MTKNLGHKPPFDLAEEVITYYSQAIMQAEREGLMVKLGRGLLFSC